MRPGKTLNRNLRGAAMLEQYLEDLENRLDVAVEEKLVADWREFLSGRCPAPYFQPRRGKAVPARVEWPKLLINPALKDLELMLLRELSVASRRIAEGNGQILNIRCNYGTTILPSLFGVEIFYLDDAHDTLPASHPLPGGTDGIRALVDAGVPDLDRGWGARVFETAAYFREKLAPYPKLSEYVRIYHPDLQGPLDLAEMIWGSDIFLAFYDCPELVKALLALLTETYRRFMHRWEEAFPGRTGRLCSHWGWGHIGRIVLRDDSAMNLPAEMYREFAQPFDRELLEEFGGGVVHFCGRGDHYIADLAATPGLTGVQLSQPEYNDMETIYRNTVDRGIPLLALSLEGAVKPALAAGRNLHGLVHCY